MSEFLRFCRHSENKSVTVLLVGNDEIIDSLLVSLKEANENQKLISKLKIHKCEDIQQLLMSGTSCTHADYVAFCIDSRHPREIIQIEEEMRKLSKAFLCSRVCLVSNTSRALSEKDSASLIKLHMKYQLHQLNGNITDIESWQHLATRILRLVSYSCGVSTGYPALEGVLDTNVEIVGDDQGSDLSIFSKETTVLDRDNTNSLTR